MSKLNGGQGKGFLFSSETILAEFYEVQDFWKIGYFTIGVHNKISDQTQLVDNQAYLNLTLSLLV